MIGLCSTYLRSLQSGDVVEAFINKPSPLFSLPADSKKATRSHVIMIGAGTGIAPFRSFLQHVNADKEEKTNRRWWLFYGGRKEDEDYLFREDWQSLLFGSGNSVSSPASSSTSEGDIKNNSSNNNSNRLSLAWSRGEERKHVQDKLREEEREVKRWLVEDNAIVFVCGETSLVRSVRSWLRDSLAVDVDALRKAKRFCVEVW